MYRSIAGPSNIEGFEISEGREFYTSPSPRMTSPWVVRRMLKGYPKTRRQLESGGMLDIKRTASSHQNRLFPAVGMLRPFGEPRTRLEACFSILPERP